MQKVGRIFIAVLIVGALASSAYAATDVRAMPDRQVRPGVSLPVWGNAGTAAPVGTGSSNGEPYTWSFSANPDVVVTTDGNLSGVVGNDRYIVENVTFTLINGSTREVITGTLDVGGTTDTVQIDIVDPADPISDTPQENLQVDVNIAIADGLRYAYLNQLANGTWTSNFSGQTSYTVSHTGLCAWAFQNSGHAPSQNTAYSPFVQQALDYLFTTAKNVDISSKAPNRNFHNHLAGTTGINPTGGPLNQNCFDFDENYSSPIAAAAVIASLTPGATVGVGAAAGLTYKQWVEEYTDWSNFSQSRGYGNDDPQGGWYYCSTFDANDHSVNSWHFLALEGAESVFGATFDPAIKDAVTTALVNRQEDNQANQYYGRFGYYSKVGVWGDSEPAYNTTCAGLSGLALQQLPGNKSVGTPNYPATGNPPAPAHLDTHNEKLNASLAHLGRTWALNPEGNDWLRGNHGNHYAMFACCRGLRLNNVTNLSNDGTFGGTVGSFDWQRNITAPDALTEGYWPYLVRTQNADGSWDPNAGSFPYDADWDTCSAIFCLQPTVFGPPRVGPQFRQVGRLQCGGSIVAESGKALSFNVEASDSDAGDTVTLDVTGLPSGATMTPPLPTSGNPVSSTFDWTPGDPDIGPHLVTFKATDTDQNEVTCEVTINVGEGGPLLVHLASFALTPASGSVRIDWETALEIDNQGFYIWRRDQLSGAEQRVSGFIPARAANNAGASYSFSDTTAVNGVEYAYFLEDLDLSGKSTRHPAVRGVANPQNPPVRLLAPAYGANVPANAALSLQFEAGVPGSLMVVMSAEPTLRETAAILRSNDGQAVLRPRLLSAAASQAQDGVLYWGVVDRSSGRILSQVWRLQVDPSSKREAVEPAPPADREGLRPGRNWRNK